MDHGAMSDRHVVADRRGMRLAHHMHDGPVLNVRTAPDPDPMHVAPDHHRHPDAAFLPDFDVADHLRAVVDESGRMDARKHAAVRPEHLPNFTEIPKTSSAPPQPSPP